MIGKIYLVKMPYYDKQLQRESIKARPCLVIGQADRGDFVILPISSVSDQRRIDKNFDIKLDCTVFSFLNKTSYLRTHKQCTVNLTTLHGPKGDLKADYNETFLLALHKVEEFQKQLIARAK